MGAITLAPGEERAVVVRLVYPADATPPQVLSLLTADLSTCLPMSILKALSSGTIVAMCLLPSVALAGPFGFDIHDKTRPDRRYDYCAEHTFTSNIYNCTSAPKPNPSVLNALNNKYGIYDDLDKDYPGFNEIYSWFVDANGIAAIEYQVSHEEERVSYFTIHNENMQNDSF